MAKLGLDLNNTPPSSPPAAAAARPRGNHPGTGKYQMVTAAAASASMTGRAGMGQPATLDFMTEHSVPASSRPRWFHPGKGKQQMGTTPAASMTGHSTRPRGRPPGTGKHQRVAAATAPAELGGACGVTLVLISCNTGQDISSQIRTHSLARNKTLHVLQASGKISNPSIESASGIKTCAGTHDLVSLSGIIDGRRGTLKVSFEGPENSVVSGTVYGGLIADSAIKVSVACFPPEPASTSDDEGKNLHHASTSQPI